MEKYKTLIVIGDPFEDIYCKVEDGKTLECETRPGGAHNTFTNAAKILSSKPDIQKVFIPEIKFNEKPVYKILRLNNQKDIHLCAEENKYSYYNDLKYWVTRQLNLTVDSSTFDSVIIFSDYKRGILSNKILKYKGIDPVSLGIFDTKYRSINKECLTFVDKKILRCTGDEYDFDFAKNFDYTIWTDGPKDVKLLSQDQTLINTFKTKNIKAIDTCGAGDTFTAAIGAFLIENEFTEKNLFKAIEFAQECSLDVIQKNKTSITNITL